MAVSRQRHGWVGGVALGAVGFLVSLAGLVDGYPLVDFGTATDQARRLHGQRLLEAATLLLLLSAAGFAWGRCRGCAVAVVGAAVCVAVLANDATRYRNVTAFVFGLVVAVVAAIALAIRGRPSRWS